MFLLIYTMQQIFKDQKRLSEFGIVVYSILLECRKDKNGEWVHKEEYPDQLKKYPFGLPQFKNTIVKPLITKRKNILVDKDKKIYEERDLNSSIICMGERYNLIGIDVDNKNGTIEKFEEICIDNDYDTDNDP